MDLNKLTEFISERKRYSTYPTVSVDTTQRHNQELVAKFFFDFYQEFSDYCASRRKVLTETNFDEEICDNCIANDIVTYNVNGKCDICGCQSFTSLKELGYGI